MDYGEGLFTYDCGFSVAGELTEADFAKLRTAFAPFEARFPRLWLGGNQQIIRAGSLDGHYFGWHQDFIILADRSGKIQKLYSQIPDARRIRNISSPAAAIDFANLTLALEYISDEGGLCRSRVSATRAAWNFVVRKDNCTEVTRIVTITRSGTITVGPEVSPLAMPTCTISAD